MTTLTDRLELRPWTPGIRAAIVSGERQNGWAKDFPAEGDLLIAGMIDDNPQWLGQIGHRLIVERETGLVVGSIGLFWPPHDGRLEIGYGVVGTRTGRGYATEAVRALTDLAFSCEDVREVVAQTDSENVASQRVVLNAGFVAVDGYEGDGLLFTRRRDRGWSNLGRSRGANH